MIRSFFVALVSIVVVGGAGPLGAIGTQNQPAAAAIKPIPLEFGGGAPGVTVEIFLNAGKTGETTLNSTGSGNFILDLANAGKTQVQIYIDVCKDGKVVKVLFVTANGQAPPKDEDCDRRLVAASFESDCGATRITLNFRNFGGRVIGCGITIRDPRVLGGIGGAGVLVALLAAGGGDSPSAIGNTPAPAPAAGNPTPPAATTPPPTTTNPPPTNTTPPAQPVNVTIRIAGAVGNHPPGANTSLICAIVITEPPQPGATVAVNFSGPAVLPPFTTTATLNSQGQAAIRGNIGNVGTYTIMVAITVNGQRFIGSGSVTVTGASSPCPTVPA